MDLTVLEPDSLKEMGNGQASAWGMARRRLLEYWREVGAATKENGKSTVDGRFQRMEVTKPVKRYDR